LKTRHSIQTDGTYHRAAYGGIAFGGSALRWRFGLSELSDVAMGVSPMVARPLTMHRASYAEDGDATNFVFNMRFPGQRFDSIVGVLRPELGFIAGWFANKYTGLLWPCSKPKKRVIDMNVIFYKIALLVTASFLAWQVFISIRNKRMSKIIYGGMNSPAQKIGPYQKFILSMYGALICVLVFLAIAI
jgi:hypothetical protein